MRVLSLIFLLVALLPVSCFMGADGYEKNVNAYFWLYKDESKRVCLGVLDGEYRISNSYLCGIWEIGWDDSFLICKTGGDEYYIQDLRTLNAENPDKYEQHFSGPFTHEEFATKRLELQIDEDLDFTLSYY